MADVVGEAVIKVSTDASAIPGQITKTGQTAGKGFASSFGSSVKSLLATAGIASAGLAVAGFFKSAVKGASDLNESTSKTKVVFGDAAQAVFKMSQTSATSMGLSKQAFLESTSTFGNLLVSLGLGPAKAAGMSTSMVKLAGDLASFNNVPVDEALEAIRSGLVGETEPLRRFGVNMNEATLKAQALKMGIADGTSVLTPQQKALAAHALIMKQTGTAQGDFARTSAGLANQERILGAQFEDLKAQIGQAFLPVLVSVAGFMTGTALPAIMGFIQGMRTGQGAGGDFANMLRTIADVAMGIGSALLPIVQTLAQFGAAILGNQAAVYAIIAVLAVWGASVTAIAVVHGVLAAIQAAQTAATFAQMAAIVVVTYAKIAWAAATYLVATAMTVLTGPIGLVVLAIVGIIAAIVLVIKYHEQIGAAMAAAWNFIVGVVTTAVTTVINFVRDNWKLLLVILTGPLGLAVALVVRYWDQIKNAIGNAMNAIWAVIRAVWTLITNGIRTYIETERAIIMAGWNAIKAVVSGALRAIEAVVRAVFNAIVAVIRAEVNAVRAVVSAGFNALKGVVSAAMNAAKGAVSAGFNAMKSAASAGAHGVVAVVSGMISSMGSFVGRAAGIGASIGRAFISALKSALNFAGGIVGAVKSAVNSALGLPITIKGPGPLPDIHIPAFAAGGIVTSPTLAWLGESGPELVVPLRPPPSDAALLAALERLIGNDTTAPVAPQITVVMPTGDPEAAAMAVMNRLATAGV